MAHIAPCGMASARSLPSTEDYAPGDDLRFVDWNAYARTDRLFLKRFEGETNTRLLLLVDVSASMGSARPPTKLHYACGWPRRWR